MGSQVLSFLLAVAHCCGMTSLAAQGDMDCGEAADPAPCKPCAILELADLRRSRRSAADIAVQQCAPPSPLLDFNTRKCSSLDEDAQIEDQLFAHAFSAPFPQLASVMDDITFSPAAPGEVAWGINNNDDGLVAQRFEADFAEIMRRFEEEDRHLDGSEVVQATRLIDTASEPPAPEPLPEPPVPEPEPLLDLSPSFSPNGSGLTERVPGALPMDAIDPLFDMFDLSFGGVVDEEDRLLQSVQDVDYL